MPAVQEVKRPIPIEATIIVGTENIKGLEKLDEALELEEEKMRAIVLLDKTNPLYEVDSHLLGVFKDARRVCRNVHGILQDNKSVIITPLKRSAAEEIEHQEWTRHYSNSNHRDRHYSVEGDGITFVSVDYFIVTSILRALYSGEDSLSSSVRESMLRVFDKEQPVKLLPNH